MSDCVSSVAEESNRATRRRQGSSDETQGSSSGAKAEDESWHPRRRGGSAFCCTLLPRPGAQRVLSVWQFVDKATVSHAHGFRLSDPSFARSRGTKTGPVRVRGDARAANERLRQGDFSRNEALFLCTRQ